MTFFYHVLTGLLLVILQTTLLPFLLPSTRVQVYDLLVPFVVYLAVGSSLRHGVPIVLFLGLLADHLSGGPMGWYSSAYLWIYAGIRALTLVLSMDHAILLSPVIAVAVLAENLILFGLLLLFRKNVEIPIPLVRAWVIQAIWGFFTGPMWVLLFRYGQRKCIGKFAGFSQKNRILMD